MKKTLGIIIAVAILLLGGALWLFSSFNNQDAAKVSDVVSDFAKLKGPESSAPGHPKQGVYTYAVTGQELIVRSPLRADRTLPTTAPALIYNLPDGQFEIQTKFSEQHIETARYALKPDGLHLTFAKTVIQVGPFTVTKDRVWKPTLIRLPANAKPGATTSGTYAAGDTLTMKVTTTVMPPATVTVGGKAVPATVVKFDQVASGEYTGGRTETFYWGKDGVLLRYVIDSSLKGETNLDFKADQTLTSLVPKT